MDCDDNRGEELLLLEAGELGPWRRWQLLRHLNGCTACRRRRATLSQTMTAYASTIHPESRRPARGSAPAYLSFLVALAVLGLLLLSGLALRSLVFHGPPVSADAPCRPGLASDACR
jgi:anti-sigma factor RsiW